MPMRPLLTLGLVLVRCLLAAQQPFPTFNDHPRWNVVSCFWHDCTTDTLGYADTTQLCGHTYALVDAHTEEGDPFYVRNDGPRTLYRTSTECSAREYTLYDYSLQAGDSIYVGLSSYSAEDPDTTLFKVDLIDTVTVLGIPRRRFHMLFDPCGMDQLIRQMEWLEGIGSRTHPFYPMGCLCDACESSYWILCADSADVQIYQDPGYDRCSYTTVGIEDVAATADGLRVLPGAGDGRSRVILPEGAGAGRLDVFDVAARLLSTHEVGNTPDLSIPVPTQGVLVVRFTDHAGSVHVARTVVLGP